MTLQSIKYGERQVYLGSPTDISAEYIDAPFVALVAASCQEELDQVLSIASKLLDKGCKEFCCVGLIAERLHDQLDYIVEDTGLLDVVTTWHENVLDGCEYFLFGAGGQSLSLLALIAQRPELVSALTSATQTD